MPTEKSLAEMSEEELVKKYNAKVKTGVISVARGKYFVTVEGKKSALDQSLMVSAQPLEKIVKKGMEVRVVMDPNKAIIVIIVRLPKIRCYHFVCYIPVPDLRPEIDRAVRVDIIKRLIKENRLDAALGKQLIKEIDVRV